MNNKRWSLLAIILIIIGFAGMAYQSFNFGDEDPYHEQKWTLEALNSLTVESEYDIDVEVIESTNGTNYIEIRGNMAEDTINRLKKQLCPARMSTSIFRGQISGVLWSSTSNPASSI